MVRSYWSGAVAVMLACVEVTWGQTPMPTSSARTGGGTVTIQENGKSLRCRVITSWSTQDGSKAYQLQTLDNGEMITVVEDGPATTAREPLPGGKAKSQPMQIFHWGNSRVAPPGVPTPPGTVAAGASTAGTTTTAAPTNSTMMKQGNSTKDQVVWWEEKNGKRVSPMIVTNGTNPFEQNTPITAMPQSNEPLPTIVDQPGYVRTGPTSLPNKTSAAPVVQVGSTGQTFLAVADPTNTTNDSSLTQNVAAAPASQPIPTTASVAGNGVSATTTANAPRPTILDKIGNWFHPKRETNTAVQSAEAKPAVNTEKSKDATGSVAPTKVASGSVPFSTARMDNSTGDILLNPEKFDPSGAKLSPRGINMNAYRGDPAQLMPKQEVPAVAKIGPAPASYLPPPPPLPTNDGRTPLGAQSVLAASANPPTNITYVPVPVATVPDTNRLPLPPAPSLPEPPRPYAQGTAFVPPPPLPDNRAQNPANAFGPMNPQASANQPVARNPQLPGSDATYLPSPVQATLQQPVQPVQYNPVPVPTPGNTPAVNPAMDRRQAPAAETSGPELGQIIHVLRESPYPAQREWAANTLGTYDSRSRPEVVQLLVTVAQQDPAATVRAACVYSLGRMKAAGEPVLSTLNALRNDGDQRVREEVEQALVRLGTANKQ